MSSSPLVRVRKLLDRMKADRDSPRLKRFLSRASSREYEEPSNSTMDLTPKEYPTVNHIHILPAEAIFHILSFLEVRDFRNARCVNREWSEITADSVLWKGLCESDWNVTEMLDETWQATYLRLEELFTEGTWEGMSKWIEPEGFDNEQMTTVKFAFHRRKYAAAIKIASPCMIRRVDSSGNTIRNPKNIPALTNFQNSQFRINGTGVTINCSSHSLFRIDGERISHTTTTATFRWMKQFEKHTSIYIGTLDYLTGVITGPIDYNDGTTHWKGIFTYTKMHRKYAKMEEARVA